MRLIDADALNKELQQRVGSPIDDKLYEINLCIIDAPTIDAIPVKWLEDRVYDMKRAPLYRRYAEMLLMEWLQEQKKQEMDNNAVN